MLLCYCGESALRLYVERRNFFSERWNLGLFAKLKIFRGWLDSLSCLVCIEQASVCFIVCSNANGRPIVHTSVLLVLNSRMLGQTMMGMFVNLVMGLLLVVCAYCASGRRGIVSRVSFILSNVTRFGGTEGVIFCGRGVVVALVSYSSPHSH